ncbi:hypothetical protein TCE0_018f05920 [Talaromyces pinophilus]|uniref:Uncharacterized protein n=1 Tax=Talaromyces pinophilus TaxID=128442 RepID=A0A510NWL7_TALPI|nr:hypothetical protein TCE0_018f05920 [Talaromyces pinophilus]
MFEPLNYTVKLWTDEDILQLIKDKYSWILTTYETYPQNIQRADIARLLVIHAEGGIYADLDVYPTSAPQIQCLQHLGLKAIFASTVSTLELSNHFFMAERGSPLLQWTLYAAKRRGAASRYIFLPYLQTGMLYAESKGMVQDFLQNYRSLNVTPASEIFTAEESKSRWGGDFRDALWDGISQTYFNPRSGSGDGDGALRSIIQASIDEGATWQQARVDVSTLIIDENMMIAAGAIQCSATFPADQAEKLNDAPMIFNAMAHTEGESIPPRPDGKLKFNYERSFTNYEIHQSGEKISVPPLQDTTTAWNKNIPQG